MSHDDDIGRRRAAIAMGIGLLGASVGVDTRGDAEDGHRLSLVCAYWQCKSPAVRSGPPTGATPGQRVQRQDGRNVPQGDARERNNTRPRER
jgi:hypothetical protein